jgi:hypothetical protein
MVRASQAVCRKLVLLCRPLGRFSHATAAIDGSKFKVANNCDRNLTPYKLLRPVERGEGSIQRYLDAMEMADRHEDAGSRAKSIRLANRIANLKQQMQQSQDVEAGVSLATPPAGVDTEHRPIVACKVNNIGHDRTSLAPMAQPTERGASSVENTKMCWKGSELSR